MRNPTKDLQNIDINSVIPDESMYPMCIPSYKRPDAGLLHTLKENNYPGRVYIFIRNDPEQKKAYKKWKKHFKIICLNNVHDIGETRAAIVDWCIKHNISHIFMSDDDLSAFDYVVTSKMKDGRKCLKSWQNEHKKSRFINPVALKLWQYYLEKANQKYEIGSSCGAYRTYSWMYENTKKPWMLNNGYCNGFFYLNIEALKKHNINYISSSICHNEDKYIQLMIMQSGLYLMVFNEFTYSIPPAGNMKDGSGNAELYGMENGYDKEKFFESYQKGTTKFYKNVLHEKEHPGVIIKNSKAGLSEIKFVWKYWRKPYV